MSVGSRDGYVSPRQRGRVSAPATNFEAEMLRGLADALRDGRPVPPETGAIYADLLERIAYGWQPGAGRPVTAEQDVFLLVLRRYEQVCARARRMGTPEPSLDAFVTEVVDDVFDEHGLDPDRWRKYVAKQRADRRALREEADAYYADLPCPLKRLADGGLSRIGRSR